MTTWTSRIPEIVGNQIPFAIAKTLNMLAQGAAEDARTAAGIDLNIRRKGILKNFIRAPAKDKATKKRLKARVVVAAPNSSPATVGSVLTQHEESGTKTAFAGRSVASPSRDIRKPGAKRTLIRGTELKNFLPLRDQSFIDSRQKVTVGQKGSFLITLKKGKSAGKKMLLQRYGRGSKSVRGLWLFVPQTKLTPKLRFNKTVSTHVKANLTRAFKAAFSHALASARPLKNTVQSSRI